MPKARFATLTSWSYSVYTQYLKCPFSVCLEKIQRVRIQEPPNPAFEKGDAAHTMAEVFVATTGKEPLLTKELPGGAKVSLEGIRSTLVDLRKAQARTELEWAFTRELTPTGWTDRDCWLRMKSGRLRRHTQATAGPDRGL